MGLVEWEETLAERKETFEEGAEMLGEGETLEEVDETTAWETGGERQIWARGC